MNRRQRSHRSASASPFGHSVQGNSYKMIAADLTIAIDTVRSHIRKIYEKLHVHSMNEAVAIALKNKIV